MAELKIPVGVSDFKKIRENKYYYVDKSNLIAELLKTEATEVTLITRPRRFGKTLGMSMLAYFFDIREDSRELFESLNIGKNVDICKKWMNQFPTLFLTFKNVDGLTFPSAYAQLQYEIAELYREHSYLLQSEVMQESERKIFTQICERNTSEVEIKRSLQFLMCTMQKYYKKPVIFLLDEYDVPLAKASSNHYYEKMLEVIRSMLSTVLKDNRALCFAVITGCLRISKESIFTGTNNFAADTISDNRYNEFFGFTAQEVNELLRQANCENYSDIIRKWYDGYYFGNLDIYCPWDVLNYVRKLVTQGQEKPENFWEHTSDNAIIGAFLQHTDFDVTEKFEILLSGGYIKEPILENLTYDFLTSSEENLWSILYLTGYLTKGKKEQLQSGDFLESNQIALKIPNAEVMDIFRKSVMQWFKGKAVRSDRRALFQAFWNGNDQELTVLLSDLLFDTISFHDYAESFYHAFLTGLLSNAGYIVESNFENGLGRSDIVVKDKSRRSAIVIEVKIANSDCRMERECQIALRQIEEKQYAKKIERSGFKNVICYGIAFCHKNCMCLRK